MRCVVVDDEPVARAILEKYVRRHDGLELVAACESAIEAVNVLSQEAVDLLFLDVVMPEMSGLELVRSLSRPPKVIFVSARSEFAVEAFDVEVTDYLVKPVSYARFVRAVERASRTSDAGGETVFVKVEGRLVKVSLSEVRWIEAQGDYVLFHLKDRELLASTSMRKLEEALPKRLFTRVHRSYIVRLDQIDDIEDTTIVIGRSVIPISASYRERLLGRLNRV